MEKYTPNHIDGNQAYQSNQAREMLECMTYEEAIAFCTQLDWQGTLNALYHVKRNSFSSGLS